MYKATMLFSILSALFWQAGCVQTEAGMAGEVPVGDDGMGVEGAKEALLREEDAALLTAELAGLDPEQRRLLVLDPAFQDLLTELGIRGAAGRAGDAERLRRAATGLRGLAAARGVRIFAEDDSLEVKPLEGGVLAQIPREMGWDDSGYVNVQTTAAWWGRAGVLAGVGLAGTVLDGTEAYQTWEDPLVEEARRVSSGRGGGAPVRRRRAVNTASGCSGSTPLIPAEKPRRSWS